MYQIGRQILYAADYSIVFTADYYSPTFVDAIQ